MKSETKIFQLQVRYTHRAVIVTIGRIVISMNAKMSDFKSYIYKKKDTTLH